MAGSTLIEITKLSPPANERYVVQFASIHFTIVLSISSCPVPRRTLEGARAVAADPSPAPPSQTTEQNSLGQQILSQERVELDALKAGDFTTFGNLIADEAVFVDALGTASKAEVLKHTEGFKLADYKIEDEKFLPISADTGMISYYVTEKGVSHGKEFTAHVYASALWTKRLNDWVCLFSQETAAK